MYTSIVGDSGYDDFQDINDERVQETVPPALLCPICYNLVWKPVECYNCRRIFCTKCIDEAVRVNPGTCPCCRNYRKESCSPIIYSVLCGLHIQCYFASNGCSQILSYEQLEQHEKYDCLYRKQQCRGCRKPFMKKDLNEHEKNCEHIEITCSKCQLIYKQKQKHDYLDCLLHRQHILEQNMVHNDKYREYIKIIDEKYKYYQEQQELFQQKFTRTVKKNEEKQTNRVQVLEQKLEQLLESQDKFEFTLNTIQKDLKSSNDNYKKDHTLIEQKLIDSREINQSMVNDALNKYYSVLVEKIELLRQDNDNKNASLQLKLENLVSKGVRHCGYPFFEGDD
ncbi:unnamed protein product [Didymodactylos carnosus]|uniref:RING-type domain-containing protein n=1 Tax=Didymodactylos carnosus TaxID=1234261 RepID=A0A814RRA7_9BILA|nr:unnamed protein product [Didymodactylos carnosus]CAF1137208.1 unnamed protein product [Didymodactylos carnosus]CAF3665704.1 unnamed protein product [Didymodactylos carnosus]CAF3900902.1 unnamed protein product [Didymodactylos carnosus]